MNIGDSARSAESAGEVHSALTVDVAVSASNAASTIHLGSEVVIRCASSVAAVIDARIVEVRSCASTNYRVPDASRVVVKIVFTAEERACAVVVPRSVHTIATKITVETVGAHRYACTVDTRATAGNAVDRKFVHTTECRASVKSVGALCAWATRVVSAMGTAVDFV